MLLESSSTQPTACHQQETHHTVIIIELVVVWSRRTGISIACSCPPPFLAHYRESAINNDDGCSGCHFNDKSSKSDTAIPKWYKQHIARVLNGIFGLIVTNYWKTINQAINFCFILFYTFIQVEVKRRFLWPFRGILYVWGKQQRDGRGVPLKTMISTVAARSWSRQLENKQTLALNVGESTSGWTKTRWEVCLLGAWSGFVINKKWV